MPHVSGKAALREMVGKLYEWQDTVIDYLNSIDPEGRDLGMELHFGGWEMLQTLAETLATNATSADVRRLLNYF